MMDWIIEGVKFVGGLGGLASSAFLIYDRIFRNQPIAFLLPAEFKTNLRIANVASETIIIDEIVIDPPVLKVAKRAIYTLTARTLQRRCIQRCKAKEPPKERICHKAKN